MPLALLRIGVIALWLPAIGCDTFGDPGHSDQVDPPPDSFPDESRSHPPPPFTGAPVPARMGGGCLPCKPGCQDCGVGCQCSVPPDGPEPWNDPFMPTAEPGWRDSKTPFCSDLLTTFTSSLWSNGDSVFALVSGVSNLVDSNPAADTPAFNSAVLTRLFRNDGDGWALLADTPTGSSSVKLTGIPPATPVTYDNDGTSGDCLLSMFGADGARSCVVQNDGSVGVGSVAVVSKDRAFALQDGAAVLAWDGTRWSKDPLPLPRLAQALWADDDELAAVGAFALMRRSGEEPWTVEDLQLGQLTSVWARGVNDVWVGTIDGKVLHFDGDEWQKVVTLGGVTCSGVQQVTGITGSGDHVWIWGERVLMRFDGEKLESFGNWSCLSSDSPDTINSVWVNAPDDVFVSVSSLQGSTRCGSAFVAHYDGTAFHRL